jgi:hypothetical protein
MGKLFLSYSHTPPLLIKSRKKYQYYYVYNI